MNFFNETSVQEMEINGTNQTAMNSGCCNNTMMGCSNPPIYECPQERVCHRYINYEVPHIMPMNTKIINHHVYKHTYRPLYTCCEENVCENVFEPRCF